MDLPSNIRQNVPLAPLTAYRIGGPAQYYCQPDDDREIIDVLNWAEDQGIDVFVLGAGTNLLIADRGFPGLVVHLRGFQAELGEPDREGIWSVGAGAMLTPWVRKTGWCGYAGIEALIGIPGTVGGALLMNAGAFSQEISDCLLAVKVITPEYKMAELSCEQIGYTYRQAPGLEGMIVLSAEFQLKEEKPEHLISHMREIVNMRRNRQPLQWPSCGSVFKRPAGDFAGRLIEEAGLKGRRQGGAEVAVDHANFIINRGDATAVDVLELIKKVKARVEAESGIALQREVILVGFTEEELHGS